MAYMRDGRVFPHLPGELVGNFNPQLPPGPFNSQKEAEQSMPDMSRMRYGRPCPTPAATSEKLSADGWVGVYLTAAIPLPAGAVEVAAPEWMSEPQPYR